MNKDKINLQQLIYVNNIITTDKDFEEINKILNKIDIINLPNVEKPKIEASSKTQK